MLKPYESIDWESRANSEGFSSVKSMVIHYKKVLESLDTYYNL